MTQFRIDVVINPNQAVAGGRRVQNELDAVGRAANRTRSLLQKAFAFGAVTALTGSFALLTNRAIQYNTALAEVETLTTGTDFNIRRLNQGLLDQAALFGSSTIEQAGAAYDIVSAGASSAAEALEILDAANRLAVGGVTEVGVAADGLTSILNAYGDAVGGAADVSDILFVGVRQGKTTIDELATSIGKVAPLAASAGVGFDELVSSVAALTAGGISTRESVTGIRAILAAVVRPTQQASDAAERLGIQFNAAALQSQGLEAFLADVIERTGGSTDEIAELFGGVEALVPVLALSGEAGEKFAETIEAMGDRAGATQEAFDRMANSPGFQIGRLTNAIDVEFTRLSQTLLNALVPVIRFLADNMDELFRVVLVLGGALGGVLVTRAIPAVIGGLRAMAIAAATNPFGLIAIGAAAAVTALIAFADRIMLTANTSTTAFDFIIGAWEELVALFRTGADFIIGLLDDVQLPLGDLQSAFDGFSLGLFFENFARALDGVFALTVGIFAAITRFVQQALIEIANAVITVFNDLTSFAENFVTGLNVIQRRITFQEVDASVVADFGIQLRELQAPAETMEETFARVRQQFIDLGLFSGFVERSIDRANTRAAERTARERETTDELRTQADILSGNDGGGGGTGTEDEVDALAERNALFARTLEDLEKETEILGLIGDERDIRLAQLAVEDDLRQKLRESDDELTEAELNNLARLDDAEAQRFRTRQEEFILAERRASLEQRLNGITRESEQVITAANQLLGERLITQRQFNMTVQDAINAQRQFNIEAGQGTFADAFILQLDRMADRVNSFSVETGDLLGETFNSLGNNISTTIGDAIFDVDNLGESFKSVARTAISQFVAGLVQIGLQNAANFALSQTLSTAATAKTVGEAGVITAAMAPAAAATSLATAGANAAGAGIGISTIFALIAGLVGGLAIAGFRDGTGFVDGPGGPRSDMILARLSRGEGVVNERANRRNPGIVDFMNNGGQVDGGGSGPRTVVQNFNFPNADPDTFRRSRRQVERTARQTVTG